VSSVEVRLSVPLRITVAPRELSDLEWTTLEAAANCLIPASSSNPAASAAPNYRDWVRRALAARAEHFEVFIECLAKLESDDTAAMWRRLEELNDNESDKFIVFSSVVAGAYLMVPDVRAGIGYPGQGKSAPGTTEAADQLEDGILDPVVARGPIFVSAAGE
jgi:hypothetical protein